MVDAGFAWSSCSPALPQWKANPQKVQLRLKDHLNTLNTVGSSTSTLQNHDIRSLPVRGLSLGLAVLSTVYMLGMGEPSLLGLRKGVIFDPCWINEHLICRILELPTQTAPGLNLPVLHAVDIDNLELP